MVEKKRARKRKASTGRRDDAVGDPDFLLSSVIDSPVVYGRSLPITRLNRLIHRESVTFDIDDATSNPSPLATLVRNLQSFVDRLPPCAVTKAILSDARYARFFQVGFNACWSDYQHGPPKCLAVVGRGALGFLSRERPTLDVSAELPQSMFNAKDYVNYRYLNKRNSWICRLHEALQVSLAAGGGSALLEGIPSAHAAATLRFQRPKTFIELLLRVGDRPYRLCISAHVDAGTFKHPPLAPARNNVRIPTSLETSPSMAEPVPESDLRPTPTYNCSILEDLFKVSVNSRVKGMFTSHKRMRGALTLLTVWARSQGLTHLCPTSPPADPASDLTVAQNAQSPESAPESISNVSGKSESTATSDLNDQVNPGVSTSIRKTTITDGVVTNGFLKTNQTPDIMFNNGLSGCVLSLILCHVVECNKFPPDVEAFPLFLAAVNFMASMDFDRYCYVIGTPKPLALPSLHPTSSTATTSDSTPSEQHLDEHDSQKSSQQMNRQVALPQLYLDGTMLFNVLHNMATTVREVIDVAKATAKATADLSSPFLYGQLFDLSHETHCHSDLTLILPYCPPASGFGVWELARHEYMAANLKAALEYGLQDRLRHLYFRHSEDGALMALVGLDDSVQRSVDVGPLTNSPEAVYFREFWGALSETRSFNDGTISECLLWNKLLDAKDGSPEDGSSLEKASGTNLNLRILRLLLRAHFKTFEQIVITGAQPLDITLADEERPSRVMYINAPVVEVDNRLVTDHRSRLMNAYNDLNGLLRSLEGVPLKVSNVFTCSAEFGYADVGASKRRHRLLLELESSTKWPNGAKAIRSVKVALAIAILKELFRHHDMKSRVAENGDMELQFQGVKFVLAILCQKETHPLLTAIRNFDPDGDKVPDEGTLTVVRDYIRSMQVDRCKVVALKTPSFSASLRLSKAFAASCLLPDSEFVCEMLNCFIFGSTDFLLTPPLSGYTGFVRFLYLVAHYDWASNPVVIHDEAPRYDMATSKKPPWAPYFWVSTPEDPYCLVPQMPSAMLSRRFVSQCGRFLSKLEMHYVKPLSVSAFFAVERAGYTLTIELENLYRRLRYSTDTEGYQLSFDEARFLLETFVAAVRQSFPGLMELAYNELEFSGLHSAPGHLQLHVKFNPVACIPASTARALWPQHMVAHDDRACFVPNFPALLAHIRTIGEGLVRDVTFM
ncbi:nucleolar protein 6 [Babesia caballi]|uniref:Nucleolar protein 6 n=1 Tax=Babesia caballi TaxID=5871 RepID=A0AAV4LSP5_BABCB|nr:nucleolar protein 6 [Babesia caballi]